MHLPILHYIRHDKKTCDEINQNNTGANNCYVIIIVLCLSADAPSQRPASDSLTDGTPPTADGSTDQSEFSSAKK